MPDKTNKDAVVDFSVDYDTIKPYFAGRKKHRNYVQAVDAYFHMSFHFDGYFLPAMDRSKMDIGDDTNLQREDEPGVNIYFKRLIDLRRPSESDSIKSYRRVVYLPFTQGPCFKVYNSLRKIVKASDWKIDYSKAKVPSGVADDETLEKYCEQDYPQFNSIENWFYNYGMKNMLIDANALIYVLPMSFDLASETEYYQPVATIVSSKNVLDYKENEYCVFISDREYEFTIQGGTKKKGKVLGIITKDGYWEARQNNKKTMFDIVEVGQFSMEYLPAWLIGGVPRKIKKDSILYQSFMSPMLPGLDAMAMACTDEEAEWVQHVYSTMWYFSQQDCKHCMGAGKVKGKGNSTITCSQCNGTGSAPKSPFRDMVLKTGAFDAEKMPTPPAGYIQKQTDIAKAFKDKIADKEYAALSSINHEFLAEGPLNVSGKSKEVDRQELENYTYSVAYHTVEFVLKDIYYFVNEFRYALVVPNPEERESMLPKIAIPEKYDLLTENIVEEQLKAAKDANADPEIITNLEIQYVQKKFPNDEGLRERMLTIKQLNPFPGISVADIQSMLLTKSVTVDDVILSNYLRSFVERAFVENEDFFDLEFEDKMAKMQEYVAEKKKDLDAAQKLKDKVEAAQQTEDPNNPGFDMQGKSMGGKPPKKQ